MSRVGAALALGVLIGGVSGNHLPATGNGTTSFGGGSNSTSFGGNSTHTTPSCNSTLTDFWKTLNETCGDAFNDLECHSLLLTPHKRIAVAVKAANCGQEAYRKVFGCAIGGYNSGTAAPVPISGIDNDPATDVEVDGEGECDKPEYIPIFEGATQYYFELSSGLSGISRSSSTCCPVYDVNPPGFDGSGDSGFFGAQTSIEQDTQDRLHRVFADAPVHYSRCFIQKPNEIKQCIRKETDKLKWLPKKLPILYGGQIRCPPTFSLMIPFIFAILFELLRIAAEIFLYKKGWLQDKNMEGEKPRAFSWLSLVWWMAYAFGQPIITALALYRSTAGDAVTLLMGVFALTPRAFSIVAFVSGIWLSKGYGAQLLFIDSIIGIVCWSYFNTRVEFWKEVQPPTYDGAPDYLGRFYKGVFLATFPSGILAFVYFFSGVAFALLIGLSMWIKQKGPARLAGYLFGMWLIFFAWCATIPIFAIAELVWVIYVKFSKPERKGEARVFPPVRWHRAMFSGVGAPHWMFRVGKHFVYWAWCLMQFIEFVGRWMAIVYLLPLLGDSFCPSKVAESAALYVIFGAVMMVLPLVCRWLGF